jgi:hypothetical protein
MADEGLSRSRTVRAAPFLIMLITVPAIASAQDFRVDDPPEAAQTRATGTVPPPSAGLWSEPKLLSSGIRLAIDKFGDTGEPKSGPYLETSNMITGSGWVSLGPGYRKYIFDKRGFLDASAAASWHLYKMVQGRFEMTDLADHHLAAGVQGMWQDQTQVNYFGLGEDSLEDNQSQYRMRSRDVVAYATYRPAGSGGSLALAGEVGYLRRPTIDSPGGTFKPDFPETTQLFPTDPGVALSFQPNYLHSEWSITSDTRDHRSHPTYGGLYRAAMTTFSDRSTDTFSFRQYEAEAAHFIPLGTPSWILALHGWVLASDVQAGHEIPFYLMPSLGGNNTLRGYHNFRFHDENLAVVNVESRWAIFTHVDAALFYDAGNVAHRFEDLNLDKTSWGAGLRLHTERMTFARVDVAHGSEGWHFLLRTSDPLRLSRVTRRVAAIPFVP